MCIRDSYYILFQETGFKRVLAKFVLIVLLLCAAAMVYVLIKSKATGEALELAGRQLYIVLGSSMEPTVGPGSLLVVKAVDPADLKREDVITFIDPADPERVISSRIVEIDGLSFITRPDANKMNDPGPCLLYTSRCV